MATEALSPAPSPETRIYYNGQAGRLFGLGLKVAALSLITLGFYRFWGKTEIRRYLWSRLRLVADSFEYTGTGKELFLGFLIVLAVLIPYGIVGQALGVLSVAWSPGAQFAVGLAQTVVFLFLIGYAIYRARRYRLSRTLLRGIRFGQAGSAARYGLMFLGYFFLTVITLGIAKPVGDVALYRFQTGNTHFGDRSFDFDGRPGEMMGRWILCLLLIPFTLGLSFLWYVAYRMRYFAAGTRFDQIKFALPVRPWDLVRVYAPYLLALFGAFALLFGLLAWSFAPSGLLTTTEFSAVANLIPLVGTILIFGFLAPVLQLVLVTHRFLILAADRLAIEGVADFESIIQGAAQKAGGAEGMADALDVGAGVEVGF